MPVKPHVGFLLEHPVAGKGQTSVFDHPMWKHFAEEELMGEISFEMNGRNTTLGGNLDLWHLEGASMGVVPCGRWRWLLMWRELYEIGPDFDIVKNF